MLTSIPTSTNFFSYIFGKSFFIAHNFPPPHIHPFTTKLRYVSVREKRIKLHDFDLFYFLHVPIYFPFILFLRVCSIFLVHIFLVQYYFMLTGLLKTVFVHPHSLVSLCVKFKQKIKANFHFIAFACVLFLFILLSIFYAVHK